jgi:hypothetical protein
VRCSEAEASVALSHRTIKEWFFAYKVYFKTFNLLRVYEVAFFIELYRVKIEGGRFAGERSDVLYKFEYHNL